MSDLFGNHIVGFPTRLLRHCALTTGKLSLESWPRNTVPRMTDCPDMTLDILTVDYSISPNTN